MDQTASKERAISSLTKKIGQTTYKVNVFFAENTTATFEDKLLHLMANEIANRKQDIPDAE
ncbi:transposon-encoded TnpW family protein [Fusibacillus kribbianus]|uniref:Transposon-encoded TnpW family protein n=1 Tax=Fusibacillus kribbianus TaxID=3044208 RepID=A0AAP4EZ01_9FIRM|nr:transposon-encoded TnpW family protein [Ruminococcus sp. YH-rum2234]MDI9243522.1 transposon-encoded TnpW family protein [Ruminococcus sp. YH-rum2234]